MLFCLKKAKFSTKRPRKYDILTLKYQTNFCGQQCPLLRPYPPYGFQNSAKTFGRILKTEIRQTPNSVLE